MKLDYGSGAIDVNMPTRAALLSAIDARFADRAGFALATVNLDHLTKLPRDSRFAEAYAAQDFVVADGNPIVWLSRVAGRPVELMPGSDLVIPLAHLAAQAQVQVALVGSHDGALADAKAFLTQTAPGLKVVRTISPPMGFDPDSDVATMILQDLAEADVGLCFLALGAPKQELFAARGRKIAPQVGFASIGAGLDFLGGHQKRAPKWVRGLAMEWFWRMAGNPRRMFKRYAMSFAILPGHVLRALRLRV